MNSTLMQSAPATDELAVLGPALHHGRNVAMSMRGYAELLATAQAPPEKREEWAGRIVHHLDRLDEFYTRLEWLRTDGERPRESVSLALVLSTACREVQNRLARRGLEAKIKLELLADPLIRARAPQIGAAFGAFVENAVEADPQARATVRLERDEEQHWQILVEDRGPGLEAEVLRNYGKPFFTQKPEAMGLGVFTARTLLERNDLSFTVTCGRLDGTRVHIQERQRPSGGDR